MQVQAAYPIRNMAAARRPCPLLTPYQGQMVGVGSAQASFPAELSGLCETFKVKGKEYAERGYQDALVTFSTFAESAKNMPGVGAYLNDSKSLEYLRGCFVEGFKQGQPPFSQHPKGQTGMIAGGVVGLVVGALGGYFVARSMSRY